MAGPDVKLMTAPHASFSEERLDHGPVRRVGRHELTPANRDFSWVVENVGRVGWEHVFGPEPTSNAKASVRIEKPTAVSTDSQVLGTRGIDSTTVGEPISQGQGDFSLSNVEVDAIAYGRRSPQGEPWSRRRKQADGPKGPGRYSHRN